MNKSNTIATRKTISLFLAFMLIAGTIAAFYPSSTFMTEVDALSDYDLEDNYHKSQIDNTIIKKKNCMNDNININGVNSGDVNLGNKDQLTASVTIEEDLGINSLGSGNDGDERYYNEYNKNNKHKGFDCIVNNNNNNEQVLGPTPTPTPTPTPPLPLPSGPVYIEWTDNGTILFRASTDGGRTFGTTQNISSGAGTDGDIASFDQNIYIVWNSDDVPGGDDEILFRASTDGGQTFGQILNLSNNPTESQIGRVAAYGQNVYVVWEDTALGEDEILFRASTDGGQTFGQIQNLSMDQEDSSEPDIYAYGQNVYVVWNTLVDSSTGNREIFLRASTDGGQTFGMIQNLSNNIGISEASKITAYEQNVYVVWEDEAFGSEPEIFFRASTDGGQTFGMIQNLSNNSEFSINPSITTFGQNVYVVWQDNTLGNSEIFFRYSIDNGQTFVNVKNLSTDNATSRSPDIRASGQNVYVVWSNDPETNNEIFFRTSTDGGQTFGQIQNISMTPGNSVSPGIAVS